jgi:hypothetical protein
MNYTFKELQEQYEIIIPQIQRDYAQGREDKENENKIKSYDFILKIINVLTTDNPALNLDFVYGYTKKINEEHTTFFPLDGQQRLTTLWLLHWFLSPKEETEKDGIKIWSVRKDVKEYLSNFTYATRNSSKRFCEKLIDENLPISDDVCTTIKDANWFRTSWENDPTVVSMLNMLDTIQKQDFDKDIAWKNLSENRNITFDYIDIKSDEFKLTDELYIKMNSRGKPLTAFENFKAEFSEILSAKDTDYLNEKLEYNETKLSYQKYFAFKIDGIWTDLFWKFVVQKDSNKSEYISSCFMNFFIYVAQMCYFKDNVNKGISDFKKDFSVFKKKDNALFLFNMLDWFYKISLDELGEVCTEKNHAFFKNLFLKGEIDNTYQGQVHLFEEIGVNLFEECIIDDGKFDNRNRIILYCLVSYVIKYNLDSVTENLRHYIRVVRNLLQATRQRNETVYNTNVRINSFGKYWKLFHQLLAKPNVYNNLLDDLDNKGTDISDDILSNEKEKAQILVANSFDPTITQALFRLEEFKHFNELIHNLKPADNVENLTSWSEYVREIWACNDDAIVASLITCGFGGFFTNKCLLGETWFWGNKDNWNTILAGHMTGENLSGSIISLLDKYKEKRQTNATLKPQEILETIVQDFLDSLTVKDWQYYFCKYKKYFLKDSNYYSWNDNKFEHEILGSTSSKPLSAYHINPYVKAVSSLLNDTIIQGCYARYSDESCLADKSGFRLSSKQDGWHIIPGSQVISDALKQKYNINDNNVFKETDEKDRIEIAVDFCKEIFK